MKISNYLMGLAVLVAGFGCRSAETRTASNTYPSQQTAQTTTSQSPTTTALQGSSGNFDYTVEMIPNPRLTATSREGDKPTTVYSSNIIAVHMNPRGGATVSSTNSPADPQPENPGQSSR